MNAACPQNGRVSLASDPTVGWENERMTKQVITMGKGCLYLAFCSAQRMRPKSGRDADDSALREEIPTSPGSYRACHGAIGRVRRQKQPVPMSGDGMEFPVLRHGKYGMGERRIPGATCSTYLN